MKRVIAQAIESTKKVVPGYFEGTCKQRLQGGAGSCFEGVESIEEMEQLILEANWEPVEHPNVAPYCQAYLTRDIKGGRFGLVEIKSLPETAILVADDRKKTGKVSMTIAGHKGEFVNETYLIIGPEQGHDVVFTFHPGEPVRESKIETQDLPHGTQLSKKEALEWGFELAKLI